ncbi:MAG: OmpA family protein, partial [Gammaproteobacteria bacterium]|nr:OmpA family protein [Gammaproteobacteria bacterium]
GSREYNIALADRRAQAVSRMLMFQGATKKQIEVISYGEEKPVAFEHNEESWSQNRRVQLVYEAM